MADTAPQQRDGLPSTLDEERSVIGCAIRYGDCAAKLMQSTRPQFFRDPLHRAIMVEAHKLATFDPLLIGKALRGKVQDDIDPVLYLAELGSADNVPSAASFDARLNEVIKAAHKQQLYSIGDTACEAALNGRGPDEIYRQLAADLDDYRREADAGKPRFAGISAADFASATYEQRYIIDRLLIDKQPCVIGGPKKSLKTSLAVDLALSLRTGPHFLSHFPVLGTRTVLLCSAESGLATLQETALRVCRAMGCELSDIDGLTFSESLPRILDASDLAEFGRFVEDVAPDVVILDPLYRMHSGEGAESVFKMGNPLAELGDLCLSHGATPIVCHHLKTGRLNQYAPADLDDLAYAGCAEYFRQWLLLSRREQYEPGSGHHSLWLTVGGSAGHNSLSALDIDEGRIDDIGGRRWATSIQRADEARSNAEQRKLDAKAVESQKQIDEDRAKVCRLMAKHPAGATKTFIRDHSGVSSRRWSAVFAAMYDAGELVTCEVIVSNHKTPKAGYRLGE